MRTAPCLAADVLAEAAPHTARATPLHLVGTERATEVLPVQVHQPLPQRRVVNFNFSLKRAGCEAMLTSEGIPCPVVVLMENATEHRLHTSITYVRESASDHDRSNYTA
jgi:hypothetical protein